VNSSTVDRQRFSAIAHRDHDYMNPICAAKVERLLDLLPLDAGSRVLDLGCGRAELSLRIIERFGSTVVAVDNSSMMLDAARERAGVSRARAHQHHDPKQKREVGGRPPTNHQ
jgi:cyclopropane fatty-acyl-phospholipid synthase-like methyltransferase